MQINTVLKNMAESDVVRIISLLVENGIKVHVDGGWGVDALLGEQTRPHEDLDIAVPHDQVQKLRDLLGQQGYAEVTRQDTRDCNFVLADSAGHQIDVHTYIFDEQGRHVFGIEYPLESLTGNGEIGGMRVDCISAEWIVKFHSGYELDMNDFLDVSAICRKFQIALPDEFERFL